MTLTRKVFRFSPGYEGGGYLQVHLSVGSLIDWYNIQFYNRQSLTVPLFWYLTCQAEGPNEYITCENLLMTSSNNAPQSALFQIAARGVPLSKLVIGKPGTTSDAHSGVMSTSLLADCLEQAKQKGWSECLSLHTGVVIWLTNFLSRWWTLGLAGTNIINFSKLWEPDAQFTVQSCPFTVDY